MRLPVPTDNVRDIVPLQKTAPPGWLQKALGFIVRLSLTNRENWPVEGTASGERVTPTSVLGLSTGWGCVNLIAGTLGTLPFEVWLNNPRTGFPERATGHWLNRLLARPNQYQTRVDLLEYLTASLELRGNAYARKGRLSAGGSIVSLTPIDPDDVYPVIPRSTNALEYRVRDWRTGEVETLTPDDVWHVRGFAATALGGMSPIAHAREVFGLAQSVEKAASSTFKNGVRSSGVLSYADWLTDTRKREARQSLEELKGAEKSGKPIILEGGVTWTPLSFSPVEAQMLEARGMSVEEICRVFGVPPVLVGHTEKVSAWGTGIQEITLGWVKYGLRRRFKRMEASADQQLLTADEIGRGYFLRYNVEALLRADSKGRSLFYEVMTRCGIMTINECRRLEGLPPVPGGDVPRMQSQNVPIGAAMQAIPVPTGDAD